MYLSLIVLPLLGSIASGFLGRKVGVRGSQLITCLSLLITTLLAVMVYIEVCLNSIPVHIKTFPWVDSETLNIYWSFTFDSLTVSMLIPVLIVSLVVHIYSIGYMSHDPHNQRFFSYLSLFTFMMIILVTSNNYLVMFVGWEGVGVCSYLLVSFWYTRIAANQSSLAAFITNRVGDCFLSIGMFAIVWTFGNLDYSTSFSIAPYFNEYIIFFIGLCILIGAMAKSSQVGLHIWLPMAMEGPTPVSALIHAATMVTAGVYLLMRCSPIIEYSNLLLLICLLVGAVTTIFSALVGLFQQDIKKIIAYSTMSQLGMMVIGIGLSSYGLALFHLMNHAFYKALLFLGAGIIIHGMADNQDIRKFGGLRLYFPLTYTLMFIGSLSLMAFPFLTGYYSKDLIIESAYGQYTLFGSIVFYVATIGAALTTFYSFKILYLTFITNPNGSYNKYSTNDIVAEAENSMIYGNMLLALFTIYFGYICRDMYAGVGSQVFSDNAIYVHPYHEILLNTEFSVPTLFKLLPLFTTIGAVFISVISYEFIPKLIVVFKSTKVGYNIYGFLAQRFLVEMYYNNYITNLIFTLGGQTTKILDKGAMELVGPYGLENGLKHLSNNVAKLDTGIITSYALYILVGLTFYIIVPYIYNYDTHLVIIVLSAILTTSLLNKH